MRITRRHALMRPAIAREAWPSRPVRLVVPFTDAFLRVERETWAGVVRRSGARTE